MTASTEYSTTPDGRYFVVRGRLWRTSNPHLQASERQTLVKQLMQARREVHHAKGNLSAILKARAAVNSVKIALGERGPAWWDDGAPDYNRKLAPNTPYAEWYERLLARV